MQENTESVTPAAVEPRKSSRGVNTAVTWGDQYLMYLETGRYDLALYALDQILDIDMATDLQAH